MTEEDVRSLFQSALSSATDKQLTKKRRTRAAHVAAALLPVWQPDELDFALVIDAIEKSFDAPFVVGALSLALAEEYPFDEPHLGSTFVGLSQKAFDSGHRHLLGTFVFWAHKRGRLVPEEIALEGERFCQEVFGDEKVALYREAWAQAKARAATDACNTISDEKPSE